MDDKKMEKFGLLNLIRAISGQSEQSGDDSPAQSAPCEKPHTPQQGNGAERANILAAVIERHDAISYRIKNQRNKK